ncbi:hypothetical protein HD806DRAFT_250841 [Xylariaceae sp. AK1471]|nr:hypothetical protein HD806DRAFT_250841 [Xylariaceae sp. AK1471]
MDPLSVAASIAGLVTLADVVFRGVYKYYKTASDASDEIKELANQLQSLAGILHSLGILADALEQDGTHATIQMTHVSDATKLLGDIQARLNKAARKMSGTKLGFIQQSLKWPFTKTRTKELTEKLAQHHDRISLALHVDSLSNLVELLSTTNDLKIQMSTVKQGVENLQMLTRVEIDAEHQRILDFFLKVNPQPNLDTSIKLRHPGTGTWLTDSLPFQQWIETADSKMWLSGNPGVGKTVLAGAVVQKALEKGKSSSKVGVAFFFCDYKDEKSTISSNILGAMASQLARQNDQAFDELKKLFESLHPRNGLAKDPDSDVLHDCLERIFETFDQVILVADGLDECGNNTDGVTQTLVDLADHSANVSMALLSRKEYMINLRLQDSSFLEIEISAQKEDLLLYVGAEIDKRIKDGRLRINNMELKDEIYTKLSNEADGMFRWVTCQLDYICGCPTDADRKAALKQLPPTLDATYERILRRINQGHPRAQKIVQKCIQLIAVDWTKLRTSYIRHLISVPETLNATLDKHAIVTEAEISLLCSSFVRKSEDGRYFEFSHFTVREFFERKTLQSDPELAGYHVSEFICNAALGRQCLRYLQLRNFDHKPELDNEAQTEHALKRNQKFIFYPSAAIFWPIALRRAPNDSGCLELAKSLFHPRKTPSFISWAVQLCAHYRVSSADASGWVSVDSDSLLHAITLVMNPRFRTVHLAAALDLPEICEHLLQVDSEWNTVSPIGTPLECAIGRSFCLADNIIGVPRNISSFRYAEDIEYATHQPGQVISVLAAAGSAVQNPPQIFGGRSLMECATFCALATLDFSPISYLIHVGWVVSDEETTTFEESMACVVRNYPAGYNSGPYTHKDRLASSLLDLINSLKSCRVFDSDPGYGMCATAWSTAIKLQCDFTKDIALMDTRIALSLEALVRKCEVAVLNDDVDAMKTCLADGRISGPDADDDGTDACGYSLLRQAVSHESVKVVRLLIEHGYSVSKSSPSGLLPIHEALDCGQEIIGLLLESGASHLDRNLEGNSIWHLAAENFEFSTLSALVQLTGDQKMEALQMKNKSGFTPLTLAIQVSIKEPEDDEQGTTATTELLLNACNGDASCWQCAGSGWELAAQSGSEAVIQSLAETDVAIDIIWEGQSTPLHVLNTQSSIRCVELLQEIFPTAQNIRYEGRTPVEAFIYRCTEQCKIPQKGVIASLAGKDVLASYSQENRTLWEYICTEIIGSATFESSDARIDCVDFMISEILQTNALEIHEKVKDRSAALLLFSSLQGRSVISTIPPDDLREVISRTQSWTSDCLAKETIEYTKFLITWGIAEEGSQYVAKLISIILSNGMDVHLRSGSSSLLEEACMSLDCDEEDRAGAGLATHPTLERRVFLEILSRVNLEQLNSVQLIKGGCLHLLTKKPYRSGSLWMVEQLVKKGVDPNKYHLGPDGDTVLVRCLSGSALPVALLLLKLGADPTLRPDIYFFNASHAAALRGHIRFLESLLTKVQENSMSFPWEETASVVTTFEKSRRSFDLLNALHLASLGGHVQCLQFFLDRGLIPNATSTAAGGYNCLHFAALEGHAETIKFLYSLGLDLNQPADDGTLPLHFAVRNGYMGAVDTLLKLGSAICPDGFGVTPQMYAEKHGHDDIRKLLDERAADSESLTVRDQNQHLRNGGKFLSIALGKAIKEGDLDSCQQLYDNGCPLDIRLPNCGMNPPLAVAILEDKESIIQWLLDHQASVLFTAYDKGYLENAIELLAARPKFNHFLPAILTAYLKTAWDVKDLSWSIYEYVICNNNDGLSLIIDNIEQNIESYRLPSGTSTRKHSKQCSTHRCLVCDTVTLSCKRRQFLRSKSPCRRRCRC